MLIRPVCPYVSQMAKTWMLDMCKLILLKLSVMIDITDLYVMVLARMTLNLHLRPEQIT